MEDMKLVYVLCSGEKDYYWEQALMSVTSARMRMPGAEITVLVDDTTAESMESPKRSALKDMAHIISVPFEEGKTARERSRLIKTAIPKWVEPPFLYIDCDTVVARDLSSLPALAGEHLAGVADCHVPFGRHVHYDTFRRQYRRLGYTVKGKEDFIINGGLLWCPDTEETRRLFKKWNELWKYSAYTKGDFHDEPSLNEAAIREKIGVLMLPGQWNCQLQHNGLGYLRDACILHYFSSEMGDRHYSPYYKLADKALEERIKQEGAIPPDILAMLREPCVQFNPVHLVNDERIVALMTSPLAMSWGEMKLRFPRLFRFFELEAIGARKVGKALFGKRK